MRAIIVLFLVVVASAVSNAQVDMLQAVQETGKESATDLATALSSLLDREKQQNKESFQQLFMEKQQRASVITTLAKTKESLHNRAVFLERLQSCLTENSANEKLASEQAALEVKKLRVAKEEESLTNTLREMAEKESSLAAQEDFDRRLELRTKQALVEEATQHKLLTEKASELKQQVEQLKQAEEDLKQRVAKLNKREDDLVHRERDIAKMVSEVQGQHLKFVELRTHAREEIYAKHAADECIASIDSCDTCISKPGCAWCRASSQCLSHNVNSKSDGLTSGQCSVDGWLSSVSDRLTTLSINTFGADTTDEEQRIASIFDIVIAAKYPDVVAFQEVSDVFLGRLRVQPFVTSYYHLTEFNTKFAPGGLLIMSRFNITKTVFSEQVQPFQNALDQRPRFLLAQFQISTRTISVVTTALDWRDSNSRIEGLNFIAGQTDPLESLLLLGDFNFDDGAEPETSHIPLTWMDVWSSLMSKTKPTQGPNADGYTWDPMSNWYARYSDPNSRPSRIDRMIVRSSVLMPRSISLVGCPAPDFLCQDPLIDNSAAYASALPSTQPSVKLPQPGNVIYPSSHYGLLGEFSIFTPHC